VEAVIGAIAVDRGTHVAIGFAQEALIPQLLQTLESPLWRNWHGNSWFFFSLVNPKLNPALNQALALPVWRNLHGNSWNCFFFTKPKLNLR